jgi:hypothetical protein
MYCGKTDKQFSIRTTQRHEEFRASALDQLGTESARTPESIPGLTAPTGENIKVGRGFLPGLLTIGDCCDCSTGVLEAGELDWETTL